MDYFKEINVPSITLTGLPSDKELQWLNDNIGERRTWLPHYISGIGWKIQKTTVGSSLDTDFGIKWTLDFDDEKLASYYILKFK